MGTRQTLQEFREGNLSDQRKSSLLEQIHQVQVQTAFRQNNTIFDTNAEVTLKTPEDAGAVTDED